MLSKLGLKLDGDLAQAAVADAVAQNTDQKPADRRDLALAAIEGLLLRDALTSDTEEPPFSPLARFATRNLTTRKVSGSGAAALKHPNHAAI